MNERELYEKVSRGLARGNNVEIRKKPDGTWVISEVKRIKVT